MKIGPLSEAALTPATAAVRSERASTSAGVTGAQGAGVPVSVSAAARSLEVSSAGNGIDEAKVAAVRAAIANGTFKVDAGAIADTLLSNAQEVLSRMRD